MKIKKGDQVRVIAGKEKGKTGRVISTIPSGGKVILDGINMVHRHRRPKKQGEKGQIVEISSPMNVSNIMLLCPLCSKVVRVEQSVSGSRKERKCKKCQGTF